MKKLLLSTALVLFTSSAFAQAQCNTRDTIITNLKEKYQEKLTYLGSVESKFQNQTIKGVMEIFVNKEDNSFSLVMTNARGLSCVTAVGKNFQDVSKLFD